MPDQLEAMGIENLERDLTRKTLRGAVVNYTSRGRRYTFYWLKSGRRLAVKVHKRGRLPRLPTVEALAAKLTAVWSCPECGVVFAKRGKRKYCSAAHAARSRKRRWQLNERRKAKDAAEAEARKKITPADLDAARAHRRAWDAVILQKARDRERRRRS